MKSLFHFLHIVNILFVAVTLTALVLSEWGISYEFWLAFYQLSFGIIQLLSLRFFTSETKTKEGLYWAFVGVWLFLTMCFAAVKDAQIITLFIIPMLIACYSVYVSWHTLRDFIRIEKHQQPITNN